MGFIFCSVVCLERIRSINMQKNIGGLGNLGQLGSEVTKPAIREGEITHCEQL